MQKADAQMADGRNQVADVQKVDGRRHMADVQQADGRCAEGRCASLLATEAILEQAGELGVAEGHKHQALLSGFAQRVDTFCQRQQRPAALHYLAHLYKPFRHPRMSSAVTHGFYQLHMSSVSDK